jgi:hypothetical protein
MKKDIVGPILLIILFILLIIAGIISYQSIDWDVLKRMENQPLVLPTQIPTNTATSSATQNQ